MKNKLIVNYWNYKKKLKKHKIIDTVILDDWMYSGNTEDNVTINNFVIKPKKLYFKKINHPINLYNILSENIYFGEKIDEEGLNISLDFLLNYKFPSINLHWSPEKVIVAKIDKLNVNYKNKVYSIELKKRELKEINILVNEYDILSISIRNENSQINYKIDSAGIRKNIDDIFITKQDLNNGELDLTKFNDFSVIALGDLNVDMFKIKKEDINNLKYIDLYEYFYIENIKVIDGSEMKLNPEKIIPFNSELKIKGKFIMDLKKDILIYVDSKNNLKVFDKKEILKDKKIEQVDFIEKKDNYIIIYRGINNYKLLIDDKEFKLTKLFMYYIKNNLYKYCYKIEDTNKKLTYEEFVNILTKYLSVKEIVDICESYLVFKDNLKKIFQRGFAYEYFMYLHKKGLDSVIFKMCESTFDISKFDDNEIDELNTFVKKYVNKIETK